ncbi:hypothetical protein D3C81_1580420 [compost metagenome]
MQLVIAACPLLRLHEGRGHRLPQLCLAVQNFRFAVVPFIAAMGGIGAAVQLQIQIAAPFGQLRLPLFNAGEEAGGIAERAGRLADH